MQCNLYLILLLLISCIKHFCELFPISMFLNFIVCWREFAQSQTWTNNQKLFPRGITLVGVNDLRKSLASTQYSENQDPRAMLELCDMMGHTAQSHLSSYLFRVSPIE